MQTKGCGRNKRTKWTDKSQNLCFLRISLFLFSTIVGETIETNAISCWKRRGIVSALAIRSAFPVCPPTNRNGVRSWRKGSLLLLLLLFGDSGRPICPSFFYLSTPALVFVFFSFASAPIVREPSAAL